MRSLSIINYPESELLSRQGMSRRPEEILAEIGQLIDLQIKAIASAVERGCTEAVFREHDE
jgi:hypothetical protein